MKRYEAIGVVEALYFTTALELVDAMCKSSEIQLLANENTLGGRLVTIIVGGSISNVNAAIEAAKLACEGKEELLKMALTISMPHEEIMKFIVKSETVINETVRKKRVSRNQNNNLKDESLKGGK